MLPHPAMADGAADSPTVTTNHALSTASSMQNMTNAKELGWKLVTDIVVCLVVGIPIAIFRFAVTPYRRGYFCDDDSIRLNYKESTVSSLVLYFVGTLLPVAAFLVVEYIRYHRGQLPISNSSCTIFGFEVHPVIASLLDTLFFFAFACVCSQLFTDVAKYTVGRLRPHFLDVCQSSQPCGLSSIVDPHVYILDYRCSGSEALVREARLSFPSGHSSFSSVTLVYLVLRLKLTAFPLLKPLLQFGCVLMTLYTGLSRISDNKHHWSDVLAGFCIGTSVAIVVCFAISDLYVPHSGRFKKDSTSIPLVQRGEC